MKDYYKMSKIAEESIWMMTFAQKDLIKCLTFLMPHTNLTIFSSIG